MRKVAARSTVWGVNVLMISEGYFRVEFLSFTASNIPGKMGYVKGLKTIAHHQTFMNTHRFNEFIKNNGINRNEIKYE